MKPTEAALYRRLKREVPGFYTRLENSISSGISDVVAVINENTCLIELKILQNGSIRLLPSQVIWHLEFTKASGSNNYMLVGSRDDTVRLYDMNILMHLKRSSFNGYFIISLHDVRPLAVDWLAIRDYFNEI